MNDLIQTGIVAVVASAITALVAMYGHRIARTTKIDTTNIDDRGKFTRDLMAQLEWTYNELGELKHDVSVLQRRESVFVRLFSNVGAELRVLNGVLMVHMLEVSAEQIDKDELKKQMDGICDCFKRMQSLVEEEGGMLTRELLADAEDRRTRTVRREAKENGTK